MNKDRKTILELLDKVGASYSGKITVERGTKKLLRYLEKNGVPKDLTATEKETLKTLGATILPVTNIQPDPEPKPKKEKGAPKAPPVPRADWMTAATEAVMESKTMKTAAKVAVGKYKAAGGRITDNSDKWGVLYTTYASKVLIKIDAIEIDDKGRIIEK